MLHDMIAKEWTYDMFLNELVKEHGDKEALWFKGDSVTFRELRDAGNAYAAFLMEKGVKPGDMVALWGFNSINWLVAYYGIIKSGAVAVLINYGATEDNVCDLSELCDVKYIISGKTALTKTDPDIVNKIGARLGIGDDHLLFLDMDVHKLAAEKIDTAFPENDSRRSAVILFTTGTTSMPKAVMVSQRALLNQVAFDHQLQGEGMLKGKALLALPLFHSFGILMSHIYMATGTPVCLLEEIKIPKILDTVYDQKVTDMAGVPTIYLGMMELEDFKTKSQSLRGLGTMGGGMLLPENFIKMTEAYNGACFCQGYGQTEAAPIITTCIPADSMEKRMTTIGKALPYNQVELMSPDGTLLAANETGEIVFKGISLMNGYYKLTREDQPIDAEGWLHTGDLGFKDDEGYVHITGRLKDIIIRKGENIAPTEVEGEIIKIPGIMDAKVMGVPHKKWGESVEACVVLNEGAEVDFDEVKTILRDRLAHYKVPDHFFVYDKFPVNTNGKLDQKTLKADLYKKMGVD